MSACASAYNWASWGTSSLVWLRLSYDELALFAAFWLALGMIDELAVDLAWIALRISGRARTGRLDRLAPGGPLRGTAAVFIAAWQEADVIGTTVRHALAAWPQTELRLYVGCYPNDRPTAAAARDAAGGDARLRVVVHDRNGPTTKADCLNRIYRALCEDEAVAGPARCVIMHDAEDMVHPAELVVLDAGLETYDFVQLPVRAELVRGSRWIASHYADEFAESHAKAMVVRHALGAVLPGAGVGCAIARPVLAELTAARSAEIARDGGAGGSDVAGPFSPECLTEDYELGWRVARSGYRSCFLRLRDDRGELIATRSYFPATLDEAVRQKTRWLHGIAYQGWDRIGWWGSLRDVWMATRDRRGPLLALVLFAAYATLLLGAVLEVARWAGATPAVAPSPELRILSLVCLVGLPWRLAMRFIFTVREYGLAEGILAVPRVFVGNIIAIMSGRRAFVAYVRSLAGAAITWDKTAHRAHPAARDSVGQISG